jgi:alpha-ketoglutarate-dependent dioxygenase FTO
MFTILPEESLGTVAKFHAVDNLMNLYMMRKHAAAFKAAEFTKHFTMGVARLGATLFAAM